MNERTAERLFRWTSTAAGIAVTGLLALIVSVLVAGSAPMLGAAGPSSLVGSELFGVPDLMMVTVSASVLGLVLALPLGVGVALFLTWYVPEPLRGPCGRVVDALAAVPSVVYGLWGWFVLGPALPWAAEPVVLVAGIVLALMILPTVASVTTAVFRQTPAEQLESALALGATRWEMIRVAVLTRGRRGLVVAGLLGLGRALGETVLVLLVLRAASTPARFPAFGGAETFAAGLMLVALTFAVQATAGAIAGAGGRGR